MLGTTPRTPFQAGISSRRRPVSASRPATAAAIDASPASPISAATPSASQINIKVRAEGSAIFTIFKYRMDKQLDALMASYCDLKKVDRAVIFTFDGKRLAATDRPSDVFMEDGDEIIVTSRVMRTFWCDWLRCLGIHFVVLYHAMQFSVNLSDPSGFPLPDNTPVVAYEERAWDSTRAAIMRLFLQFGMPIFFLLAGRVTAFNRDTPGKFFLKKTNRLVVSLTSAFVLFVPSSWYIGRDWSWDPVKAPDGTIESEFYNVFVAMMPNGKHFTLGWLWFLLMLALISIAVSPLTHWINLYLAADGSHEWPILQYALTFACINVAWCVGLKTCFSSLSWAGAIGVVLPFLVLMLLVAVFPTAKRASDVLAYATIAAIYIVPVAGQVFIAYSIMPSLLDFSGSETDLQKFVRLLAFHPLFYIHGFLSQCLHEEYHRTKHVLSACLKPIGTFFFLASLGLSLPGDASNVHWTSWPIYHQAQPSAAMDAKVLDALTSKTVLYVLGAWVWMYLWVRWSQHLLNDTFSLSLYSHAVRSGLIVYVSHWFWMQCVIRYVILPLGPWDSWPLACSVIFFGTLGCCYGLYWVTSIFPPLKRLFGG